VHTASDDSPEAYLASLKRPADDDSPDAYLAGLQRHPDVSHAESFLRGGWQGLPRAWETSCPAWPITC
jgi:hypothetical protein